MRITVIGMSGTGKTHWANKLEEKGFRKFSCDELIEVRLREDLFKEGLKGGINDVSRWMGQPYEERYAQRSRRYLELEAETLTEILQQIENDLPSDVDVVVDTTGSVIYMHEDILNKLTTLTRIVYLETPAFVQKQMYELYFSDPKPVIWGDLFQKSEGESDSEALARSYTKLLEFRTRRLKQLSNITLDYSRVRDPNFTVEDFLKKVSC